MGKGVGGVKRGKPPPTQYTVLRPCVAIQYAACLAVAIGDREGQSLRDRTRVYL